MASLTAAAGAATSNLASPALLRSNDAEQRLDLFRPIRVVAMSAEPARKRPPPTAPPPRRAISKSPTATRHPPSETIALDQPSTTVELRRTAAARRLSLSVSQIDGRVLLTAPPRCPRRTAESFLDQHRDWLRGAIERAPTPVALAPGAITPFLGRAHLIESGPGRSVRRIGVDRLQVGGPPAQAGQRLVAWMREEARWRLLESSRRYADALGADFDKISIRDTRSRWGSCSSNGALSYSWRLVLAPEDVLDYVAAHEVAHLVELNHSARFWALVEKLRPDWRDQRDWLRAHGAELHRYRATES